MPLLSPLCDFAISSFACQIGASKLDSLRRYARCNRPASTISCLWRSHVWSLSRQGAEMRWTTCIMYLSFAFSLSSLSPTLKIRQKPKLLCQRFPGHKCLEFWVSAPPSRPSVAPAQPVWSPTVAMTALPFWFWMSFSKSSIQNLRLKPAALHFQSAVCCSLPAPPLPQKLSGHSLTLQRTIHNSLLIICLWKSSKCRDSRNCSNCCISSSD